MLALLGALAGAWHALDTRLTVLELQAGQASAESKADHARIDKLQDFMLTKNPDLLPLVGAKTKVRQFGLKMPVALGVAADAAEMPVLTRKAPTLAAPVVNSEKK
jgi:hypothetical protein